ncbi:hypothetical protein [Vibrio phage vB_VaS_L1]|nr:hypothetical protein [Vibrio phage vB_VaS_L1]
MSEAKFTKGEWFSALDGCVYAPVMGDCKKISTINTMDIIASNEERANAHLIAAAPEMYEMLGKVLTEYKEMLGMSQEVKEIEQLLAKARGEHV